MLPPDPPRRDLLPDGGEHGACPKCAGKGATIEVLDTIQATDDLVVEVGDDRLRVRRGDNRVEVLLTEVRHLVDSLGEAAARLVDQQT